MQKDSSGASVVEERKERVGDARRRGAGEVAFLDDRSRFGCDQRSGGGVPTLKTPFELGIDPATGDGAEVERGGAHAAELGPARTLRHRAVGGDDGIAERHLGPGVERIAVAGGSCASNGSEAIAAGEIADSSTLAAWSMVLADRA